MNNLLKTITDIKADIKKNVSLENYKKAEYFNNILKTIIVLMGGSYTYNIDKYTEYKAAAKLANNKDSVIVNNNLANIYYNVWGVDVNEYELLIKKIQWLYY